MKAILNFNGGQLFGEIETKTFMRNILIPCPQKLRYYNYTEMQYGPIPQPLYVMVFEYKRRITEELIEYEFTEIQNRGIEG